MLLFALKRPSLRVEASRMDRNLVSGAPVRSGPPPSTPPPPRAPQDAATAWRPYVSSSEPPPPQPVFHPPKKSKAGRTVATIAVAVLTIPVLAFAALILLGQQVEPGLTEVPIDDFEGAAPAPAETVQFGDFSFTPAESWGEPRIREVGGYTTATWGVPSANGTQLFVSAWAVPREENASTAQEIISSYAESRSAIVSSFDSTASNGVELHVGSLFDPVSFRSREAVVMAHETEKGSAFVAIWGSSHDLPTAVVTAGPQLSSIRYVTEGYIRYVTEG